MNKKAKIACAMTFCTSALLADVSVPEVLTVTMSQDSSRQVAINYTLSSAPAVVTLDIQTNDVASGTWASIGGQHIQRTSGDVFKRVDKTSGTIYWQADLDWPDHKIKNNGARAVVTAWALDNTPDYMVVDATQSAQPNTQRYYPAEEFLPGGILGNDAYRTTHFVMRKIMAKGVHWIMGSVSESGRDAAREKAHEVVLTNNYYMGVFPVTQSQWTLVTGNNLSAFTLEADKAMRPAERIGYNDIRCSAVGARKYEGGNWPANPWSTSFLGLLRDRTGVDFDMPSEAEWEFACRAGNGEGKWGNGAAYTNAGEDPNMPGRYSHNVEIAWSTVKTNPSAYDAKSGTAIVGSYGKNAWGLFDMHGNLWEKCLDYWAEDRSNLQGRVNIDPKNPSVDLNGRTPGKDDGYPNETWRVRRGGAFDGSASQCRSASRLLSDQSDHDERQGVRICCRAGLK